MSIPSSSTLGRFFHEEIAGPLGLELYIGLPLEIPDERLATVKTLSIQRALLALPRTPPAMLKKYFQPRSTIRKSFLFSDLSWNDRRTLEAELPAGNGVGTARAMAPIPLSRKAAPSLLSRRRRSPVSPHCPRPVRR
jgi:hypothetical protein